MKKNTLKLKALMLTLFLFSIVSFSQQVEKCATDIMMEAQRLKNPIIFDQSRDQVETFTRRYAQKMKKSTSTKATVTTIPTVVHVIHNGEAVGVYPNISDIQIQSAIANLNDAFKNQGSVYAGSTFFGASSYNSPMDIEFVLAQVKEDGSATTGIERHDVTGKTYATEYSNLGISGGTSGVDSGVLFKDYVWNSQDYMNIWIVNKIDGVDIGTNGNGTLGYATLPGTNSGVTDGLVCQARAFGYYPSYVVPSTQPTGPVDYDFGYGTGSPNASGNGTADHEVGHYLNLLHTFTGDNDGTSCPADVTVGVDSDGCADIPPHIRTNSICTTDSQTANTCVAGGGPNEYAHNFMDYSSDPCFTGFSNDQRTRVHAAIDGPRAAFKTSVGHVAPFGTYPNPVVNTPTRTDPANYGLGFSEVTLAGNVYKSRTAYFDGVYLNRVASQPAATLVASTEYTMSVKMSDGGANNEFVSVYIDYDNNGIFNSTNELVHQAAGGEGKKDGEVISFNFTTPSTGFVDNQKLRMRVISDFDSGSTSSANTINSPYQTESGNIEDYSVVFNPTLSATQDGVNASDVSIYPNPTNDVLNISNTTNKVLTSIFIYDALGRQVLKGANTDQVSVSHLTNGLYFLKLQFGSSDVVTKRFIKK